MDDFLNDDSLEQLEDSLEVKSGIFEKTWAVGQKIQGLFVIERIIGRGHFGRVYQAKDNRGRICVVKTIDPQLAAHPEVPQRLDAVIKRLLNAKHANIVPSLAGGKADGFYYLRMPYLRAPSLAAGLKQSVPEAKNSGGIPPRQPLRIIQAAAQAAQAVGWDIPHLNLLPGNMFVTSRGIVVADAGILFSVLPALSPREFSIMDSPDSRAPEVRSGLRSDASADVYSIAKLIYKLVSLQEPPLVFDDVPIVGDYPKKVRDVLLYATEENPQNRYANLQYFATAFEQVLKGDSAPAPISRKQVDLDRILTNDLESTIESAVHDIAESGEEGMPAAGAAPGEMPDETDISDREIPEEQVFPPELKKALVFDEALPEDIIAGAEEMAALWKKAESPEQRAEAGYVESEGAQIPSAPAPIAEDSVVSKEVAEDITKEIPGPEDPSTEVTTHFFKDLDDGIEGPIVPEVGEKPASEQPEAASRPRAFDEGKPMEVAAPEAVAKPPIRRVETEEELEPPAFDTGFSTAKVTAISVLVLVFMIGGLYLLSGSLKEQEAQTGVLDNYKHQNAKKITIDADTFAQPDHVTAKETLTGDDIEMVMNKYGQSTSACFQNSLKPGGSKQGAVLVSFTIQPQGGVSDAVVLSSTLDDLVAEQCLRKAVLTMQFPPFKRSAMTVSYPFKFKK